MKRTIEIDDTLDDCVETAIESVKGELENYLNENPDTDNLPCLRNDLDYSGAIHEIVDGSLPIYTHEIDSTWFLHKNELEGAYEDAGVGDNPLENNGMATIYYYIDQKVSEWYNDNAQDIFDDWYEKEQKKLCTECGKRCDNPEDLKNGLCAYCQDEEGENHV